MFNDFRVEKRRKRAEINLDAVDSEFLACFVHRSFCSLTPFRLSRHNLNVKCGAKRVPVVWRYLLVDAKLSRMSKLALPSSSSCIEWLWERSAAHLHHPYLKLSQFLPRLPHVASKYDTHGTDNGLLVLFDVQPAPALVAATNKLWRGSNVPLQVANTIIVGEDGAPTGQVALLPALAELILH